eukprot:3934159-Rhodomonas_salina.5
MLQLQSTALRPAFTIRGFQLIGNECTRGTKKKKTHLRCKDCGDTAGGCDDFLEVLVGFKHMPESELV